MTYATKDDMIALFGEREILILSNLDFEDGDSLTINETRLNAALSYASEKIDLYARSRFPWIATTPPLTLKWICADLARYQLEHNEPPRPDVVKRAEEAQQTLEQISQGKLGLVKPQPQDTVGGGTSDVPSAIGYFAQPRAFPWDLLNDY